MWPDLCFSRLGLAAVLTVFLGRGRARRRRQSQEAMVGQQYILSHYSRKNNPTFPSKRHSDIERVTAYKGNMSWNEDLEKKCWKMLPSAWEFTVEDGLCFQKAL